MAYALLMSLVLPVADFPICTAADEQFDPCAIYVNDQYYVFWSDYRYESADSSQAIVGARVSASGTVLDPGGKLLYRNRAGEGPVTAYDGTNFLVVFRDSC